MAANVMAHGTGALNIDGCRVDAGEEKIGAGSKNLASWRRAEGRADLPERPPAVREEGLGRWPANVIHDGSPEVLAAFAAYGDRAAGNHPKIRTRGYWADKPPMEQAGGRTEPGTAARFFYSAKADADDRLGSKHPTVKPVDLIAYLCRLVTPPGGLVLDPFAGSGTTAAACLREGFRALLIEREAEYVADIHKRLQHVRGADTPLFGRTEQVSMFEEAGR